MTTLADRVSAIPEMVGDAPWPDHEYVRGWGVQSLPFDTGHLLALRVFPQGSFASTRSVWHRDPAGRWSIYHDAARADMACPRYFGAACDRVERSSIVLEWVGPRTLRVRMDAPSLEWTVSVRRSMLLAVLNSVNARLPLSSWRRPWLLRLREQMARAVGMGSMKFAVEMPSGHRGLLMPERMYLIEDSRAVLDGLNLGHRIRLDTNPDIGGVALPTQGVFTIGQAMWPIRDPDEFVRTRASVITTQEVS